MKKLTFIAPPQLLDPLSGALFEAGAQGLQEGVGALTAYVSSDEEEQDLRSAAHHFMQTAASASELEVQCEEVDESWQETWQNALEAVALTERWVLRPTHQLPAPADEDTIWFQPQASFGDGSHPTTQLAARAVARWVQSCSSRIQGKVRILDVGAGNGVLGLVALKEAELWGVSIERLLALDIDEVAINSLRQNLELNALPADAMEARLGTLVEENTPFHLVVANISTPVLSELAPTLLANLAPAGTLLLTGLLIEDEDNLKAHFGDLPVKLSQTQHKGEWSLLSYERSAGPPASRPA
jgi:ribosomal protein L11 methyltransferase